MYMQSIWKTEAKPEVRNDNNLGFNLEWQPRDVPDSQLEFLDRLGWQVTMRHPDTNEQMFRKPCPSSATQEVRAAWPYELGSGYWYWYEAVAYEFTKFMTIGDDS